ncbi:MAG: VWA domain-containing protein, partial [Terriglobales bacterium]
MALSRLNAATEESIARDAQRFDNMNQLKETEDSLNVFRDTTARIDSLLVLQQLAQALKGLPGRKTLLLVGSGFPFVSGMTVGGGGTLQFRPTRLGETMDQSLYTWKLLNDANVAVYPIDTRGTVNTAFEFMEPTNKYSATDQQKEVARQRDNQIISTFQAMAAQTGGRACFFRTDLDNCIKEAVEDNSSYYLVGFYADKQNKKPGWH